MRWWGVAISLIGCHASVSQRSEVEQAAINVHAEDPHLRAFAMGYLRSQCCERAASITSQEREKACPALHDAMEQERNALVLIEGVRGIGPWCDDVVSSAQLIRTIRRIHERTDMPDETTVIFPELGLRVPDAEIERAVFEFLSDEHVEEAIALLGDDELERLAARYDELPVASRKNLERGLALALARSPLEAPAVESLYAKKSLSPDLAVAADGEGHLRAYRDRSRTSDAAVNAMPVSAKTLRILGIRRAFCNSTAAKLVLDRAATGTDPDLAAHAKIAIALRSARCPTR